VFRVFNVSTVFKTNRPVVSVMKSFADGAREWMRAVSPIPLPSHRVTNTTRERTYRNRENVRRERNFFGIYEPERNIGKVLGALDVSLQFSAVRRNIFPDLYVPALCIERFSRNKMKQRPSCTNDTRVVGINGEI